MHSARPQERRAADVERSLCHRYHRIWPNASRQRREPMTAPALRARYSQTPADAVKTNRHDHPVQAPASLVRQPCVYPLPGDIRDRRATAGEPPSCPSRPATCEGADRSLPPIGRPLPQHHGNVLERSSTCPAKRYHEATSLPSQVMMLIVTKLLEPFDRVSLPSPSPCLIRQWLDIDSIRL